MSSASRDRSARARIQEHLAQQGSIIDPSGRATALLKDAVNYQGSAVAFIQLITSMDKAGEITRDIRGKRTYGISAVANEAVHQAVPTASRSTVLTDASGAQLDIDYDELARAVLREMWRVVAAANSQTVAERSDESLDAVRMERDRVIAERDEYLRRLQVARGQLNALISLPDATADPAEDILGEIEQAS